MLGAFAWCVFLPSWAIPTDRYSGKSTELLCCKGAFFGWRGFF